MEEFVAEEKKAFTLIIIPENTSKTYTFRVRRRTAYFLGAICVLFLGSYAYVVGMHQGLFFKAQGIERLRAENDILRDHTRKISELKIELIRLQNTRQRLYELAGLPEGLDGDRAGEVQENASPPLAAEEIYQMASAVSSQAFQEKIPDVAMQKGASHLPTLWPVRGWVTAEFNEDLPGREKKHTGLDIAAPLGTHVLSAGSGQVVYSGWDRDLGLVVILDHQNGLSTLYGHCSRVLVNVGDLLCQGEAIAQLGNTGQSSAPHVHFEIRENGVVVDPRNYLGP
jgi:murein DD-endopeptidase MepM/ murein hydrolase activator NlpD